MGNNQKEPYENIQLFLQLSKVIYESGQNLQGKVHLNIKNQFNPYQKLIIGFYAQETILRKASAQTNIAYTTSQKITLQCEQTLHSFSESKLPLGKYTFPFQIKLPQNLPSNFLIENLNKNDHSNEKNIHIRYAVKAELNGDINNPVKQVKQQSDDQKNSNKPLNSQNLKYGNLTKIHYLNIVRPEITQIHPLNHQKTQVNTYYICLQGGMTKVSIFVNKNFTHPGQIIQINGQIDNLNSRQALQTLSCQLIQQNIVTNDKKLFYKQRQRGVLHIVKQFRVRKGNVQNFSFSYKIPDYLQYSHSIGNYSALIYKLRFKYLLTGSCNSGQRKIDFPLQIQVKNPKLEINIDQIPSSYEWVPTFMEVKKVNIGPTYELNTNYPLQSYRQQLNKYKKQVPSFNYFSNMNAGYMTKQSQNNNKKVEQPIPKISSRQNIQIQKGEQQEVKITRVRSKIFKKQSRQTQSKQMKSTIQTKQD